ncbi:hypothetical protein [Allosphingosinicella deserti]|uniref:hypothetical protein n=1 Tax=Allosphingosinicella deserti TaxID=2116704 RepID=UPI0011B218D1|nr:hypothetical protein [Sphingomonas deserti]
MLESRNISGATGLLRSFQYPSSDCYGEAAIVDLGGGKQLFAVREDAYSSRQIYEMVQRMLAYPPDELHPPLPSSPRRGNWQVAYPEARKAETRAEIHRRDYPLLVSFRDRRDPGTIYEVDPDDLSSAFGAGHRLRRIIVQVTSDPLTDGPVLDALPWLRDVRGSINPLLSQSSANPVARLGRHAFRYMDDA